MNIGQVLRLGEFARHIKKYTLAVPWLELTVQKLSELEEYDNNKLNNFLRGLLQATMMEVKYL